MALTREQKREARDYARRFAAGLVENAELLWQEDSGLNDDQFTEAVAEMGRIAARIESSVKDRE
ncbi:hypothetical protein [Ralstonia pseudosolanacearum]|uniref:hypothetical protein n=1 Tax=Ralstonia pseudosolanacearum TaxID=1310165 RepID=UPI003CFA4CAE